VARTHAGRVIDLGDPATQTELADGLDKISAAVKKLLNGPLTKRAILVLIKDNCQQPGPSFRTIEMILDASANLDQYLAKNQKKEE
jgi:hypothetical protein